MPTPRPFSYMSLQYTRNSLTTITSLITWWVDSLTDSRPFRQLCEQSPMLAQDNPAYEPQDAQDKRERAMTYCVSPSCSASPSDQRLCICPSAAFPVPWASPPSIAPLPWWSSPASRAPCLRPRRRCPPPAAACVDGLFDDGRVARGFSCIRVSGPRALGGGSEGRHTRVSLHLTMPWV